MKSIDTKKAKDSVSKLGNWAVIIPLGVVSLGFEARGIVEYITGMDPQQKLLSAVFVTAMMAGLIFINIKQVFKKDK